ncbi:rhomboid family intramembrane serine protease [bacterium]|nr:rhomboid family intramembrane serine protease [bacterium]
MIILPIGVERTASRNPVVTYYLIGINFVVFIYTFLLSGDPEWVIWQYGLVPSRLSFVTFFTSMFLHGGLGHILGNMLILYLYGGVMEDRLGRLRYALLFFVGGLAADALHIAVVDPHLESGIPSIGASGAISAVTGAFLLSFPRVKIRFFYFYWILIPRTGNFRVAAWLVLGFWFLKQAFFGAATVSVGSGIAFFAHIGGFVFGFFAALANERLEKRKSQEKAEAEPVQATERAEKGSETQQEVIKPL